MRSNDVQALMQGMAPVVRDFVKQSLQPFVTRLNTIEKRFAELPMPRDGKDADPEAMCNVVMFRLKPEIEEIRSGLGSIEKEIPAHIARAFEELPKPRDGESGKDGKDGSSVAIDDLAPIIIAEVAKRIEAIPKPKDGEPGRDGIGISGALINRDGGLVITSTDGTHHDLGRVVGRDGVDGKAAEPLAADFSLAPDDVAANVAMAVKMMAETPAAANRSQLERQAQFNIHLPEMKSPETIFNVSLPEQSAPIVTVDVPEQKAPIVNVAQPTINVAAPVINYSPPRIRRVTNVKHDKAGRIIQTVSEET